MRLPWDMFLPEFPHNQKGEIDRVMDENSNSIPMVREDLHSLRFPILLLKLTSVMNASSSASPPNSLSLRFIDAIT